VDGRTRAQKQHDALAAALGIAARHDDMPRLGGAAPTLVVTVGAEDYATGRGWARVEGVPDDDVLPVRRSRREVDGRTRAQKQHDALAAALGIAARHDDMPRLGGA
ncbi:hypothetical protein CTI14_58240, partial [Methylobacterium radiotolerans]